MTLIIKKDGITLVPQKKQCSQETKFFEIFRLEIHTVAHQVIITSTSLQFIVDVGYICKKFGYPKQHSKREFQCSVLVQCVPPLLLGSFWLVSNPCLPLPFAHKGSSELQVSFPTHQVICDIRSQLQIQASINRLITKKVEKHSGNLFLKSGEILALQPSGGPETTVLRILLKLGESSILPRGYRQEQESQDQGTPLKNMGGGTAGSPGSHIIFTMGKSMSNISSVLAQIEMAILGVIVIEVI